VPSNSRNKKDTRDYFNQDSARQERIQELQKTLNYTERGEKRTRQAKKSKPVEIVACPRQIGSLPLVDKTEACRWYLENVFHLDGSAGSA